MFSKSSWLHLRIPFSYFLLPVFLFSLSISPNFTEKTLLWSFLIIHFFLYPASNGYNSYFDKDEKSIGGLRNPPPVNKGLYYLALFFDAIAIIAGFVIINLPFAIMLFCYGMVSKAYSHPSVRLKKYAITSWIITGLFQGLFTFVMCYVGINNFPLETSLNGKVLFGGLLASIMLWANYPITQVYQHEEDTKHGDYTLSIMLGVKGTFYFVAGVFVLATVAFIWYFEKYFNNYYAMLFVVAIAPMVMYFLIWFLSVLKDETRPIL